MKLDFIQKCMIHEKRSFIFFLMVILSIAVMLTGIFLVLNFKPLLRLNKLENKEDINKFSNASFQVGYLYYDNKSIQSTNEIFTIETKNEQTYSIISLKKLYFVGDIFYQSAQLFYHI